MKKKDRFICSFTYLRVYKKQIRYAEGEENKVSNRRRKRRKGRSIIAEAGGIERRGRDEGEAAGGVPTIVGVSRGKARQERKYITAWPGQSLGGADWTTAKLTVRFVD